MFLRIPHVVFSLETAVDIISDPWDISSIDFYREVNPKGIEGKSSGKFIRDKKKELAVGQQKEINPQKDLGGNMLRVTEQ